jgi:lipoprotein-anchoring transpeptidase ErfK/SrfK
VSWDETHTRRRGLGIALVLAAVLIGGAAVAVLAGARGGESSARSGLPASPPSALAPKNVPLGPRPLAHWAPVLRTTGARMRPAQATVVARVPARTPEQTTNIVLVVGEAVRRAGTLWVRVRVPALPDEVQGWVPRSALGGYSPVRTRLVVDRARLTATLLRAERRVFRARVGIGAPGASTPAGDFYVRNRLEKYESAFYGPVAFGTSARSTEVSDWPAGGFVGIHGTNRPDLIPGRVSHGCIRMTNPDILRLARLMPVGTLVTVR